MSFYKTFYAEAEQPESKIEFKMKEVKINENVIVSAQMT